MPANFTGSLAISGSLVLTGSISATGTITISGSILSASYASNAELLDNLDSTSFVYTSSFNPYSSSISTRVTNLESTASVLTTASASFAVVSSSYASASGSLSTRVTTIEGSYATTGSNIFVGTQGINNSSNAISFTSTASLYVDGGARITRDLYVSGTSYFNNVTIYGTQSVNYITSSQLNIGTNIITVNTDTPTVRYGGLAVYDSGSTGLTGSILWDSENNHWIYTNPSASTYSGGMLISGPRASARGCEVGTTACSMMMGQGGDHITSSAIFHYGNATCFYGNTVVSSTGTVCSTMLNVSCIGIGTAIPTYDLTLSKSVAAGNVVLNIENTSTTGAARLWLGNNASSTGARIQYFGATHAARPNLFSIGTDAANDMMFETSGTERARITSTGIACFACRVCAPTITAGTGTASQAIKITGDDNYIEFDNSGTYIKGGGNLSVAATSTLLLSTSASTRLTIAPAGEAVFACRVCAPEMDIMPSGIGVNTLGGIMRVVTSGTATGIGIGQSNSNRYTHFAANDIQVFNDDFFLSTRCAFPLSIGTCYTSRLTFAATGVACFSCQVCAPSFIYGISSTQREQFFMESRTLCLTSGATTEIGNITFDNGAGLIEANIIGHISGESMAAKYILPVQYSSTGGNWVQALPITGLTKYDNACFALDYYQSNNIAQLRLRRTAASPNNATYTIGLRILGNTFVYASCSCTATGVGAPTGIYGPTVLSVNGYDGRVGIGTVSPANLLHVYGTDGNSYMRFTSDVATTGTRIGYNGTEFRIDQQQNAAITLRTNCVEKMRIDSCGNILINQTSDLAGGLSTSVQMSGLGTSNPATQASYNVFAWHGTNATWRGYYVFTKSRGTTLGSYTVVADGDHLGTIRWNGADGSGTVIAAEINAFVDGTPGVNDMPTRLTFSTTADNASTPTERMRITSTGIACFSNTICAKSLFFSSNSTGQITFGANDACNAYVVSDSNNSLYIGNNNSYKILVPNDGADMIFRTAATYGNPCERMRITAAGATVIRPNAIGLSDVADRTLLLGSRPGNSDIVSLGFDPGGTWKAGFDYKGSDGQLEWWTNNGSWCRRIMYTPTGIACFACQVCAAQFYAAQFYINCSTGVQEIKVARSFTANTTTYYNTGIGQAGLLVVNNSSDRVGVFALSAPGAGNSSIVEIADPSNCYSTTCNNANTINFFFSAGSGDLILQNCTGNTRDFSLTMLGTA